MKGFRQLSTNIGGYMATTYARPPIAIAKGRGSTVWDTNGKEYVDFTAGIAVVSLGHCHIGVTEIAQAQASKLVHCSNLYFNEWASKLSKDLVERTKRSEAMKTAANVFLCNSGSEANEAAIKFSRKRGLVTGGSDKYEFVAFNGGFHGRTYGALTATNNPKYQEPFAPMVPGFRYGNINDPFSLDLITENTCGVIVEPIQSEGGVNVCEPLWLIALRSRCNAVGATLIYDEIQCGLSRTGSLWAHADTGNDAQPDILTMAKALGNGYPIGAAMISKEVNDALKVGDHGTTFGGNPFVSRIGLYVLDELDSPEIHSNVAKRHDQIKARVEEWINKFVCVTELRGRGLLLGIQLDQDPKPVIESALEKGLLVITCGTNTLRIVPPLNISEEDTNKGLDILEHSLAKLV